ncbi:mast cell protease 4-like [Salminus brasiliensis]|uniref:mast cell protease 4-like n=1 Tax=Salminus brasiliensis TaxID=930266 RepID=UPI003B82FB87
MALFSLLFLATLLPYHTLHSASVNVGIINGTEVEPHSRPYMVSIQKDGSHIFGGFLLSDQYVMSAAHCWEENTTFTAVLGAHDLSDSSENAIRIAVESHHIHPHYNSHTLDNDILLLKLHKPVKKSKTVSWIAIPERDEDIPGNTVCSVAGWGRTGTTKPKSVRLREANTTVTDRTICDKLWQITSRMICAVLPGGPCKGDSGGPLVCNNIAVGIVSFGEVFCESPSKPEVYAKISAFLPWIKSIVGNM